MIIITFQKISQDIKVKLNRFYSCIFFDFNKHSVKKKLGLYGQADIIIFSVTIDLIHSIEGSRTWKYINQIKEELKDVPVTLIYNSIKNLSKIDNVLPFINNFIKKIPIFYCRNLFKLIQEQRDNESEEYEQKSITNEKEDNEDAEITHEKFINHYKDIINENKRLRINRNKNQGLIKESLKELKQLLEEKQNEIDQLKEENLLLISSIERPILTRNNAISEEEEVEKEKEKEDDSFEISYSSNCIYVVNQHNVNVEKVFFRSNNEKRRKTKELKIKFKIN